MCRGTSSKNSITESQNICKRNKLTITTINFPEFFGSLAKVIAATAHQPKQI